MERIRQEIQRVTDDRNWPVIAGFILIVVFMIGFYWRESVRSVMCAGQDENCFREWISATGGWIAAIAAYATIKVLRKQISDMDIHQRRQLYIHIGDDFQRLTKSYECCVQAISHLKTLADRIKSAISEYDGNPTSTVICDLDIESEAQAISEIAGRDVWLMSQFMRGDIKAPKQIIKPLIESGNHLKSSWNSANIDDAMGVLRRMPGEIDTMIFEIEYFCQQGKIEIDRLESWLPQD